MLHERWGRMTRRAALALLPWFCLATAGPGCSPAGQASSGTEGIPDRLEKMRALRGTGDPRRQRKRSSIPARHKSRPRDSVLASGVDSSISPRCHHVLGPRPLTSS
jgi:hypothetical protein